MNLNIRYLKIKIFSRVEWRMLWKHNRNCNIKLIKLFYAPKAENEINIHMYIYVCGRTKVYTYLYIKIYYRILFILALWCSCL